jgi:hypothetical protein
VQDEIAVMEELLSLTLGTKLEYNDYSHLEVLPNARALLTPSQRHSFWAAVSRAVRAPSRAENDVALLVPNGTTPPQFLQLNGDRGFEPRTCSRSSSATAHAAREGVDRRRRLLQHLRRPAQPRAARGARELSRARLVTVPLVAENRLDARGYGVEVSGAWGVTDFWRLEAGYTLMLLDIDQDDSADPTARGQEKDTPVHQVHAGSLVDLPWNFELDTQLYWVDNVSNQDVHDYARLDVRLGWHRCRSSSSRWSARTSAARSTTSSVRASRPAHLDPARLLREGDVALLSAPTITSCDDAPPSAGGRRSSRCGSARPPRRVRRRSSEVSLKSAFLYKFIHYAEWPAQALGEPGRADRAVRVRPRRRRVGARRRRGRPHLHTSGPVVVRRLAQVVGGGACHVLFVGSSDAPQIDQLLARVSGPAGAHGRRRGGIRTARRHHQLHAYGRAPRLRDQTAAPRSAPASSSARSCSSCRSSCRKRARAAERCSRSAILRSGAS